MVHFSLKKWSTIKDSFENFLFTWRRKPKVIESDRGKEFYNIKFQKILEKNNVKIFSRNTSIGAVFAERFKTTKRDFLKRPVFERGDGNWIDILPAKTKQYNIGVHTSTKLTPIQASLKKNEGFVYKHLIDDRNKIKPKSQENDLVRVADLKKTFSKRDTTNLSNKLYKIT